MKKQIGICALIAVLVLAVTCTSQLMAEDYRNKETKYITNTAFITAVERATYINWTKEKDGTVPLTWENLEAIRAVRELDLNYKELTDISGIEWFIRLEYLDCTGNYLRSLDLSHNPALEELYCSNNQLRSLDLSQNSALEWLDCSENRLTELDLSHNTALEKLECYENQLSELDVSQNTELEWLFCYDNQLRELDVSHNTVLYYLYCHNNQLSELDLWYNTALEWLYCYDNHLRSLDVSHNTALEELYCGSQKRANGEVQELTLTLTSEQREKWDSIWADATDEDANNYDVTLKE